MWFHSGMSEEFKAETIDKFIKGDIWGLCCTDAAGMVLSYLVVPIMAERTLGFGYIIHSSGHAVWCMWITVDIVTMIGKSWPGLATAGIWHLYCGTKIHDMSGN